MVALFIREKAMDGSRVLGYIGKYPDLTAVENYIEKANLPAMVKEAFVVIDDSFEVVLDKGGSRGPTPAFMLESYEYIIPDVA
jgi:hypothetical protein